MHLSQQTLHAPVKGNTNTNPFLGHSSFDNLSSLTKQVHISKGTENTNPFAFPVNTMDHYRDEPQPTKTKDDLQQDGDNIRARRMSLDVLKAPFAWNRRRRTNSVATAIIAPLIKSKASRRPVTVYAPSEETEHEEISKARGVRHQQGQTIAFAFPPRGNDEILKSSRYCPSDDGSNIHEELPKSAQTYKTDRRKSLNPFFDSDSDPQLEQQTIQAPEPVIRQIGNAPRRRHSEFSGFSMEDCSRLLSQHKQAQVQPDEGELWEVGLFIFLASLSMFRLHFSLV